MRIQSLREVRDHFSEVVDRVERERERVTVTRNGHAAAVIVSPEDLAQLEETLDVMSDPDALADIREADAGYRRVTSYAVWTRCVPCAGDRRGPPRTRRHTAGRPRDPDRAAAGRRRSGDRVPHGALISDPRRVGTPLRGDLAGIHSARRGTYRVLYRINDTTREIIVLRIDHRRVACRPS